MAITLDGTNGITHTSGTNQKVSLASGTSVASTTGTSVDFVLSADVAPYVKRITVMFNGVSTSGTSNLQIQIGDSGGIETSGYAGSCDSRTNSAYNSAGFLVTNGISAAVSHSFAATLCLMGSNTWVINGVKASASTDAAMFFAGAKTLSDTLTQVRITTANGTDTFDAGSINILYE